VKLTKLSPDKTLPVIDEGDGKLVRIDITSEGAVLFGGINLGDWDFLVSSVQKKLREIPDAHIVVVPDRMVPWQYVYWLMDVIRESGATKVGLGGYPDYDEKKTLLVELEVALVPADTEVELPEGMTELVVELVKVEEGTGHYLVFEEQAEGLAALYPLVSGYNAEYADEYGAAYTKDPAKTPWVLKAPATMATGQVLVTLDAIRRAAVYTVRFGGDFPPPPGKGGK